MRIALRPAHAVTVPRPCDGPDRRPPRPDARSDAAAPARPAVDDGPSSQRWNDTGAEHRPQPQGHDQEHDTATRQAARLGTSASTSTTATRTATGPGQRRSDPPHPARPTRPPPRAHLAPASRDSCRLPVAVLDPGADRVEHPGRLRQRRPRHQQHVGHLTRRGLVQVRDDPAQVGVLRVDLSRVAAQRGRARHPVLRASRKRSHSSKDPIRRIADHSLVQTHSSTSSVTAWKLVSDSPASSDTDQFTGRGPPATSHSPAEAGPAPRSCTVGQRPRPARRVHRHPHRGNRRPDQPGDRRSSSPGHPAPVAPGRSTSDLRTAPRSAITPRPGHSTPWTPRRGARRPRRGAHLGRPQRPREPAEVAVVLDVGRRRHLVELHRSERHTLLTLREHRLHLGARSSPTWCGWTSWRPGRHRPPRPTTSADPCPGRRPGRGYPSSTGRSPGLGVTSPTAYAPYGKATPNSTGILRGITMICPSGSRKLVCVIPIQRADALTRNHAPWDVWDVSLTPDKRPGSAR